MKRFLLLTGLLGCALRMYAQNFELLVGSRNLSYQHTFSKSFSKTSRFSVTNVASLLVPLNTSDGGGKSGSELMNQGYIRLQLNKWFSVNAGGFYANSVGVRPSLALGYVLIKPRLFMMLQPRMDLFKVPSFELFGLVEWRPVLNKYVSGYARLQFMSNYGKAFHNRSYQQFRVGLEVKAVQFGVGFQADEYGRDFATRYNTGLFIRRQF